MDLKLKLLEAARSWPTFSPIGAGHGCFQDSEYPVDRTDLTEDDGTAEDESEFSKSEKSKGNESSSEDSPCDQNLSCVEIGDVPSSKDHGSYWKPSENFR